MNTGQVLGIISQALGGASPIIIGMLALLFVWTLGLTFLTWRSYRFSQKLFGDTNKDDLKEILQEHISRVGLVQVRLNDIEKMAAEIKRKGAKHISKVGVVRFNPFGDTGGDQSFALAMLDEDDDGVVVSSLHGRNRTRMYAKPVRAGGHTDYGFSDEEKEAIRKAKALGHK